MNICKLTAFPVIITNRIRELWEYYSINQKTWENLVQDIVSHLALEDLFPELNGNIQTDCIVQAMQRHKILDLDNNRQQLYKKVSSWTVILVLFHPFNNIYIKDKLCVATMRTLDHSRTHEGTCYQALRDNICRNQVSSNNIQRQDDC